MKNLQNKPLNSKSGITTTEITQNTTITNNSNKNNYKEAYYKIYSKLPKWKQVIIDKGITNDRIMDEFAKEVCEEAEK